MKFIDQYIQKLDLDKPYKKVIVDRFYFIHNDDIRSYLDMNNIDYEIADTYDDVVLLSKETTNVFLRSENLLKNETVQLITKRFNVKFYNENSLPFVIENGLLNTRSLEDIRKVIKYNFNQKIEYSFINKDNFDLILKESRKSDLHYEKNQLAGRIQRLLSNLNNYDDILKVGEMFGKLTYLSYVLGSNINSELVAEMDVGVKNFILQGGIKNAFYSSTNNLKTVNKITGYIDKNKPEKFALICFDGMGVPEWELLKNFLSQYNISTNERYLFSLIPTTTKISRTAIFSGQYESVYGNKKIDENREFERQFPGLYTKSFSEGKIKSEDELIGTDGVKLIYNVFDECAHGAVINPNNKSKTGFFKMAEDYLLNSTIFKEINILKACGYRIYICSDHGTVVAEGNGEKVEKYLIEESCKRGVIVSETSLLKNYDLDKYDIPFIKGKYALLSPNRHSFSYRGKLDITHGGITVDELIVPFAEVEN